MKCISYVLSVVLALLIATATEAPARSIPDPLQISAMVEKGDLDPLGNQALTFIQISDTHLGRDKWTNSPEMVARVLDEIQRLYPKASFVVFTGDNTDGDMRLFLKAVEKSTLQVFWVPGNTDASNSMLAGKVRDDLRRADFPGPTSYHYGYHHPLTRGWNVNLDPTGCYHFLKGDNLFMFLDSTIHGHEGGIRPDRIAWAHRTLSSYSDKNVFFFSHHGAGFTMNQEALDEVLGFHRPRFRTINTVAGHDHADQLPLERNGGLNLFCPGSLQGGLFTVYHVKKDHVIYYSRNSLAYAAMAAEQGDKERGQPSSILTGKGVTIFPADSVKAPHGPLPREMDKLFQDTYWKADDEPGSGLIMRHDFRPTAEYIFTDTSGCGNDLYSEPLFLKREKHIMTSDILPVEGFYGKVCRGSSDEMTAFDSYSLNSPALTNRITVAAGVYLNAVPLNWDYVVVDKTAYTLGLDKAGRGYFHLWLGDGKGVRRQVKLVTPSALPAQEWQEIAGAFDGAVVTLRLGRKVVASEAARAGERVLASAGGTLRVATNALSHHIRPGKDAAGYLLRDIRVANIYLDYDSILQDRVVPAYKTAHPPVIDGHMNEGEWPALKSFSLLKDMAGKMVYPAFDGTRADVWMQWDEGHLYFAAMADDKVHWQPGGGIAVESGDMLQLMLQYADEWLDVGLARTDDGKLRMAPWSIKRGKAADIVYAVTRNDYRTLYEVSIPMSVLLPDAAKADQGLELRCRVRLWNNDGAGSQNFLEYAPKKMLTLVK